MRYVLNLLLSFIAVTASGATYYVDPAGSNSNDGSQGSPWLNVGWAASNALAGDTVLIQSGTYVEYVRTKKDGSSGSPITFRGVGNPLITQLRITNQFITFEQCTINPSNAAGGTTGIYVTSGNTTIRSNLFTAGKDGIVLCETDRSSSNALIVDNLFLDTLSTMLSLDGVSHVVTNNHFEGDIWDSMRCFASNTRITHNTFTNLTNSDYGANHQDIIQTYGTTDHNSTNVTFDWNLIINCPGAQICHLTYSGTEPNHGTNGWWIFANNAYVNCFRNGFIYIPHCYWYNNVFFRSGTSAEYPLTFQNDGDTVRGVAHSMRFVNNIIYESNLHPDNPNYGMIDVQAGLTNTLIASNLVVGIGAGYAKNADDLPGANWLNGVDPLFVSTNTPTVIGIVVTNLCLQTLSPCIDAGLPWTNWQSEAYPYNGSAPDIGAYEYVLVRSGIIRANRLNVGRLILK